MVCCMNAVTSKFNQNNLQESLDVNQDSVSESILANHPLLAKISHPEWFEILKRSQLMSVPAKTTLIRSGEQCENFVFVLEGQIRVYQHGEDGREVTLYYSHPGDVCVKSVNSLLHAKPFKANAESYTEAKLLLVNASDFFAAMGFSEEFRSWVMTSISGSFCDVLETFHGTVFYRLEMRMACLLGQLFERAQSEQLHITHQELALELGSTREVVSRILKHLEKQGCIKLSRGCIEVAEGQALPKINI